MRYHPKLATQLTIGLSLTFLLSIGLAQISLNHALTQQAQREITDRGNMLMALIKATAPEKVETAFNQFKQNWEYKDFDYKPAILGAASPQTAADRFEAQLVEQFRADRRLKVLSGFREQTQQQTFYTTHPIVAAPSNEIIGLQILYLPAKAVFERANQVVSRCMSIFVTLFTIVIVAINIWLRQRIIQPLKPLAKLAGLLSIASVSQAEWGTIEQANLQTITQRHDELGQLGRVFQSMVHEFQRREQQLTQQVRQLQVEIDHTGLQQQVAEIEDSDYFQELQRSAQQIREQFAEPVRPTTDPSIAQSICPIIY
jgi:nitrate/nitrite-specific signal transduction histidine kinase